MANQLRNRYDIIINGGGIVGFTLLNLILKSPHLNRCKVLLIEQATKPSSLKQPKRIIESSSNSVSEQTTNNEPVFSNRVSSITRKSRYILEKLGVWSEIKQYAKDVRSIKVWNYNFSNKIVFEQKHQSIDQSSELMFSVVENNRLAISLLNRICENNHNSVIRWNNNLVNLSGSKFGDGTIEITTKDSETGDEFTAYAPLVLGCDGFKSKVREYAQMKYNEFNLNKMAVVGTVKLEQNFANNFNDIAYQRFSSDKDTVAALLPLDEQYSSFVISAPDNYAKHLINCDNETFIDEFNKLLTSKESGSNYLLTKLHDISNYAIDILNRPQTNSSYSNIDMNNFEEPRVNLVVDNSRAIFPLVFGTTTPKMIAPLHGREYPQIALLGDSTHRVHPLAGQGLNLGIQDAMELVDQFEKMLKCGEKVFDDNDHSLLAKALKRYECNRQTYIIPMSLGILSMPYLFKLAPASMVSAFDKLNSLKGATIKFANGN